MVAVFWRVEGHGAALTHAMPVLVLAVDEVASHGLKIPARCFDDVLEAELMLLDAQLECWHKSWGYLFEGVLHGERVLVVAGN